VVEDHPLALAYASLLDADAHHAIDETTCASPTRSRGHARHLRDVENGRCE
jgi:hypothetical protein